MRQMKDSGIEWIGMIPETWAIERMKGLFIERNERDCKGRTLLSVSQYYGIRPKSETDIADSHIAESYDDYKEVYKGDFVMNIMLAWNGSYAVSDYDGMVSPAYCVFKFRKDCCKKYFHYLLRTNGYPTAFKTMSRGVIDSRLRLYPEQFYTFPVIIPPISDQQRIADYLDEKCGEIDSLIGLQEQMIEKLKAYKQSVITEAVTKGLNPNAKLVPSGIDWIGEIPEGWKVGRIKNVAGLFGRIGFRGYNSDDLNKEGVGAITLSPSNMQPMDMDYSSVTYLSWEKYYESPEIMIQNGDLLYVKTGSSYGKVSYVHDLPREATINPQILRIVPKIDNKFLGYFMQSTLCEYQTKVGVVGGTIPTISQEKINNFWVLLPSKVEQQKISFYLDEKCADINYIITLKQQKIESLKDYKKSVIYEAVTGKTEI